MIRLCNHLAFHLRTLFITDRIITSRSSGSFLQNEITLKLWGLPMQFPLHNEVKFPFSIPYLESSIFWCTVLTIDPSFPSTVVRHILTFLLEETAYRPPILIRKTPPSHHIINLMLVLVSPSRHHLNWTTLFRTSCKESEILLGRRQSPKKNTHKVSEAVK